MKEYKLKGKYGIDDLEGIYAFIGNSQGDTSCSNSVEDYNNSGGWLSFVFNCELTDEAINKEIERRIDNNTKYISQLAQEGKYGEIYENSVKIQENPIFDESISNNPLGSYSFKILDISE